MCKQFFESHGIYTKNPYSKYHYSLSLYTLYMIKAMEEAQNIEDGILFEEKEISILLENLKKSYDVMKHYKEQLKIVYDGYDVAEKISLKACRLEEGKIIGDVEQAKKIARMWIQDYHKGRGSNFTFEIGIYILFLLQQEVDYSFLEK